MIYTFYSYKGGVGRSMALANVAEWFYQQGLRVVIIDWDLEAPGLENFFYTSEKDLEIVRSQLGLIDMLMAYKRLFPRLAMPSTRAFSSTKTKATYEDIALAAEELLQASLPPISDSLFPIHPADTSPNGNPGSLWLLPAGWRSGDRFPMYAEAVQSFDWTEFYSSFSGEFYFEWMRKQLVKPELADLVLIDSRTGVTEMGGVCTRQLADVVVSVCAPNVQNLAGIVTMAKSFGRDELREKRGQEIQLVVVPSRLDVSELDSRNFFEQQFRLMLDEFTPESFRTVHTSFWDLAIDYVPKYGYLERLAIGAADTARELVDAYKVIAVHLALLARGETAVRIRKQFAAELQRVFETRLPSLLISYTASDGSSLAERLRRHLKEYELPLLADFVTEREGGDSWSQLIECLDQARVMLLVVTEDALSCCALPKQFRVARQNGVSVIFVKEANDDIKNILQALPKWMRNAPIFGIDEDLDALVRHLQKPAHTVRVPFMSPDPPELVVDRTIEMKQLKEHLLDGQLDNQRSPSMGIWGPPGSGKSTLAKVFCNDEDVIASFCDGIMWVTLGAAPNITSEIGKLYSALTGETRTFANEEEATASLAEKLGNRRCLIVINDVWNLSHLQPFFAGGSRCARLITTGDLNIVTGIGAKTVAIGEMATEEAIKMIAPQIDLTIAEHSAFQQFVLRLGKSPLALRLARSALQNLIEQGNQPIKALQNLERAFDKYGVIAFDQSNATERDQSVARSITFSLDQLDPKLRERFVQLAFFPQKDDIYLRDVRKLWGLEEFETEDQIQKLGSLSLLRYDLETKAVTLNGVIRSYVLNHKPDQAGLNSRLEAGFSHLSPEEQEDARRLCTRLVRLAHVEEVGEDTRLRIKLDEAAEPLVSKLAEAQIVAIERASGGERTVALVDDSVIESWDRLRNWIHEDRTFLLWRQQLHAAITYWEESSHHTDRLLTGSSLTVAAEWRRTRKADLNKVEDQYIETSERLRRKRRNSLAAAAMAALALVVLLLLFAKVQADRRAEATALKTSYENINKGKDFMTKRKLGEAVEEFQKAVAAKKNNKEAYFNLGLAYFEQQDFDNAISAYDQAIALDGDYGLAYLNRGRAYRNKDDADSLNKAFADYDQAFRLLDRPDNPDKSELAKAYNFRGYANYKRGNIEDALKDCRRAIELDPKYADAFDSLGSVYLEKKDYSNAIDNYNKAKTLNPSYIVAYANLGKTYFLMNETDRALKQLTEAIDLFRSLDQTARRKDAYAEALYYQGCTYARKGDQKTAVADFDEAISLNDRNVDAYFQRALMHEELHDKEKAMTDYRRVLDLTKEKSQMDVANRNLERLIKQADPRIYVRYAGVFDSSMIEEMSRKIFETIGYKVRKADLRPDTDFREVRFFYPEDKENAEKIREAYSLLLSSNNVDLKLKDRTSAANNIVRGTIEVWLPSLSPDKQPVSYKEAQSKSPVPKKAFSKKN
jgi:tetratricopeptide (TPR) repeat protein